MRYQPEPAIDAQRKCTHRVLNRAGTECSVCGSRKRSGNWEYLTEDWVRYYLDAAERPVPFTMGDEI